MPIELVKRLDKRSKILADYKLVFKDLPELYARCEAAFQLYQTFRDKIFNELSKFYELKGLFAGLNLAIPQVNRQKEVIKSLIKDERLDPMMGKRSINDLAQASIYIASESGSKQSEKDVLAGQLEGYFSAANMALDTIELSITNFKQQLAMEDEDEEWRERSQTIHSDNDETDESQTSSAVLDINIQDNGNGEAKEQIEQPA